MAVKIQTRRGTAAQWVAANPILAEGEVGLETDTGYEKVGDGGTAWNSLGYHVGFAPVVHAATSKATPVDADELAIVDSAASNGLKKLTWANLKLAVGYLGSYTFSTLPSPATVSGKFALVTDVGTAPGVYMVSTGGRWKTLSGTAVLKGLGAPVSGIANTETIIAQALIPAGVLQVNDSLRIWITPTKSGTTDLANGTVRVGTTGTTSDTAITGLSAVQFLATNGLSGGGIFDLKLISSTSIQRTGAMTAGQHSYQALNSAIAAAAATTISDASANALYVSVGINSGGTTNTVGAQSCQIQLITP